jgi:hypothetical protein
LGCHRLFMRPVGHRCSGWLHCRLLSIGLNR